MLGRLRESVISVLAHLELRVQSPEDELFAREQGPMQEVREDPAFADEGGAGAPRGDGDVALLNRPRRHASGAAADPNVPESWGKVSRNAACPCGSGKKYKHCHGAQ
jgi:preprotein translocase subunit SecA